MSSSNAGSSLDLELEGGGGLLDPIIDFIIDLPKYPLRLVGNMQIIELKKETRSKRLGEWDGVGRGGRCPENAPLYCFVLLLAGQER